jgi:hypothetical protein
MMEDALQTRDRRFRSSPPDTFLRDNGRIVARFAMRSGRSLPVLSYISSEPK